MKITLRSGTVIEGHGLKLVEQEGVIEVTEIGNQVTGDSADEDLLEKQISGLDLPIRVQHCLKSRGITTLGELMQKSKRELLQITNFGKWSLQELEKKLAELGVVLRSS